MRAVDLALAVVRVLVEYRAVGDLAHIAVALHVRKLAFRIYALMCGATVDRNTA